jgi:hypothetical protein
MNTNPSYEPEHILFSEKNCTLLLGLKHADVYPLVSTISIDNCTIKSEFHITIIGFKHGKKINELALAGSKDIFTEIRKLIFETSWEYQILEERYRISKEYTAMDKRESVIQMVSLPQLDNFYQRLNETIGYTLDVPPTHITLCTHGTDNEKAKMGIGINSINDFLQMNPVKI